MTKTGLKYSVIAIVAFLLLISGIFPSFVQAQVYPAYTNGYSDPYASTYYPDYQGYSGPSYSQYQYPSYSYPSYPAYNNGWTSSYGVPVYPATQYPTQPSYQYQYPTYTYPTYQYPPYQELPLTVTCTPTLSTVDVGNPVTWSASAYGGIGNSPYSAGNNYTFAWTGESVIPRNANLATAYYRTPGLKTASVTVYSNGQTATQSCGTVLVAGRYIPSLWGTY